MSYLFLSHVQEEGESPPAPPPRGPVYPPGTPVHQDYGTTPLGPVAASPAQGSGGAHLYPPAYDTPLHEPNYDDGYQVWISDFNIHSGPQCCGSEMFIPDPDFYPSRIQKQQQNRRVKQNFLSCRTFFCSHKFHIIEHYFVFEEMLKKKILANCLRIIELFTQKIVTKL